MENYEILWNETLKELEKTVSNISFSTYISKATAVDIANNKIVLITPTELFASQLTDTVLNGKICDALKKVSSDVVGFEVSVAKTKKDYLEKTAKSEQGQVYGSPINPKLTFDSFVVGDSNELIFAAATAVAESPGEAYNPLFIYGGSGLGKTHILMAIANYLKKNSPSTRVLYSTCDQFTNQLIESISRGNNKGPEFRNKYRNVDVLLIDDVQFLSNKPSTQHEFFDTFNELVAQNKQIVLTCDRPPKEIEVLEERLRTRFEGGLLVDVQPPELETKIAILKKKAEEKKCIIDLKVLTYIAETNSLDIRSLIGKLTNVIFASKLHEKPITIELAKEALKESSSVTPEDIQADDIINCVCDFYKVSTADVLGKKKNKEFVEPRQICMYLITELLSLPLVTVGSKMGGRDHATVIYARDKVAELIKTSQRVAVEVNDIRNLILRK